MKRIFESGRSMLEMLGVLAIAGVLSIGGVTGYSYAMNKYRANETLNELQIRIIDLSQQMQNGAFDLSLGEMGNTTRMGYPISARVSPQFANYFEVFVDNVPSGVCHRLLESKWTVPYSIFVGIDEYEADESICDKAKTVRLVYEFKDDLTDGETIAEKDRHETWRCNNDGDCKCATCENGLCATLCPEGSSCAKSYDNPNYWMCCLNENALNGLCCSSIGENGKCCTSSDNCCPPDKPLRGSNGQCYSCDDETVINVEGMTQNCAVCSNRLLTGSKKYCALKCGLKGTTNADKPLMDTDGTCHACNEAKGVNVNSVESNCNVCAKEGRYISNFGGTRCVLCGVKDSSVADKPILDIYGVCHGCDDENKLRVTSAADCLEICPNRIAINELHCGLNPCTDASTPLYSSKDGKCHSCDYDLAIPLSELPDRKCKELCPNRKVVGNECVLAGCPADKPLMDKDGGCHACDEANGVNVNGVESNCDVCAKEGRYINKLDANYCVLCGVEGSSVADKPLIAWGGTCHSCNDKNKLRVTSAADCLSICPNRVATNELHCGLGICSDNVPLMDSEQNCHPCNEPTSIYVGTDKDKCKVCVNRRYEDGYCLLN
ncbi:MAG: hypothetical protein IKV03_01245 [Alphaproteobacteria bacterium]|nr:hypothetical protein [Alphaproteobacteria bacterium]